MIACPYQRMATATEISITAVEAALSQLNVSRPTLWVSQSAHPLAMALNRTAFGGLFNIEVHDGIPSEWWVAAGGRAVGSEGA